LFSNSLLYNPPIIGEKRSAVIRTNVTNFWEMAKLKRKHAAAKARKNFFVR
jgi:hypothetical protein